VALVCNPLSARGGDRPRGRPGAARNDRRRGRGESSAIAVSYAVIGAKPGIADRFTNSEGKFVLRDVNPGQLTLSARHIGYAPLDTTFESPPGTRCDSASSWHS
jgi:hypothetical protein